MTQETNRVERVCECSPDIVQLQQRVRMLTFLSVAVVLVLVASIAPRFVAAVEASDTNKEVFQVGGLELVDKLGKTRGMWIVTEEGDATLTLTNDRQEPRLVLLVDKQGHTEISMLGRSGVLGGSWTAGANGESEIALFDGKGNARVGIKVNENVSALLLNDAKGHTRSVWSVIEAGAIKKTELAFYDTEARRRLVLTSVSDGTPAIVFPDASNPREMIGGWSVRGEEVVTIPKGTSPAGLGR